LVEHFHGKEGVAGSSPALGFIRKPRSGGLLVQAGWNALEISNEMGNSPEVVQRDYSHLFREFIRGERPEQTIAAARSVQARRP
jgi:hypothetical protein